jgi:hypothetical protein
LGEHLFTATITTIDPNYFEKNKYRKSANLCQCPQTDDAFIEVQAQESLYSSFKPEKKTVVTLNRLVMASMLDKTVMSA